MSDDGTLAQDAEALKRQRVTEQRIAELNAAIADALNAGAALSARLAACEAEVAWLRRRGEFFGQHREFCVAHVSRDPMGDDALARCDCGLAAYARTAGPFKGQPPGVVGGT